MDDISSSQSPTLETESRSKVTVSYTNLANQELFQLLFDHGCKDLLSQIDCDKCSEFPLNGGGYGDIYKGRMLDGTEVAIKVLRQSTNGEPKCIKRAVREVYRWSKLNHANIHELMGVTEFRGRLGMVSLWMEHGDLRGYIRKNPEVNRYPWCIQVTTGVSYLHKNGIIHGDLKASNILISRDLTARITDFDCSSISDCSLVFSATGTVVWSLRWAAPELMGSSEDEESADKTQKSDIYALGMTLLEVTTGESPYSEYLHDVGVLNALIQRKFPKKPRAFSGASGKDRLWNCLVSCWNYSRLARPDAEWVLMQLKLQGALEVKDSQRTPSNMSTLEIFGYLLNRGSIDLSSQMDAGRNVARVTNRGYGDTWRGKLYDGTEVSIKEWKSSMLEKLDPESLERVAREIRFWSSRGHQNLHRSIGIVMFQGHHLGIVSQWTRNGNLYQCWARGHPLDQHQIL